MKRNILIVLSVILAVSIISVLAFAIIMSAPFVMIKLHVLFQPNPSKPCVKSAEFPIEIVYEIDGKTVNVEDTYICQFSGIEINSGELKKIRTWDGYFKSTGTNSIVLMQNDDVSIEWHMRSAGYYMGDHDYAKFYSEEYRRDLLVYIRDDSGVFTGGTEEEVAGALKKYKIRLISWDLPEPIENSFE